MLDTRKALKNYFDLIILLLGFWVIIIVIYIEILHMNNSNLNNNVICAEDTVSFYAVDPSELSNLINNLQDFSDKLPSDVTESRLYI